MHLPLRDAWLLGQMQVLLARSRIAGSWHITFLTQVLLMKRQSDEHLAVAASGYTIRMHFPWKYIVPVWHMLKTETHLLETLT